ncbi:hypothetical protein COU62_03390 [Candidatus Pacearchaeota archaeon CG10_big_fil_rev_8_21_14_0_10_35_219]|nr:hypothetical protein [Candidatus Pacearchaeota archaeon]OIO42365.1 MAG: hypothetical protein AUJ63_03770 [Candidatus Pacearchaeota archaeon CG1_02_35_32]PIO07398.1 MAG: hypothetical protein COU62_03390 [Candidatus Pacearchaeota archaeon CG10_big_fil_rev_8_21_14_0_10_35_219]PIY81674.1 MAG: hypothetical protein COY79_01200 [Candidatus Pacearchaeota archaeon CG_4_10_14_0_8_um_filter_35_169]PIZ80134.1 MAG: hypothetical protein COY00_01545 [Candidatus Pacearchaeota archaeon CG_4_10_14_0_2_um_filt
MASRILSITSIYYSNPKIQQALFDFAKDREVVPNYNNQSFGKRPDSLQYPSDIMASVKKGATSFHASEELWHNPLELDSDFSPKQMSELRKSWDLLIDIDSPYLDCSKIAANLIINALEFHGVKNYGIKFSGSKGFHIIVPAKSFPDKYQDQETKDMFPEWPRAISEYLMYYIRRDYNLQASEILDNFKAIEARTNLSKEELLQRYCTSCHRPAIKSKIVKFICPRCKTEVERKNYKLTSRKLKCIDDSCPGFLEVIEQKDYYYCETCKNPKNPNLSLDSEKNPEHFEETETTSAEKIAALDLVLVAPRHLFRMPYSLHEKTALSSIVLTKEQISDFNPKDANPLNVKVQDYYPESKKGEASHLLSDALEWKKDKETQEEKITQEKYRGMKFEEVDYSNITSEQFPTPIKKLLKGVKDGRKRGLFILLTFLRSIQYSPEKINEICQEWNKKNQPPLKQGYLKSQIDWHLKQKRKILPPNYSNQSFYKDLKLFDKQPQAKNPLSEILRKRKK